MNFEDDDDADFNFEPNPANNKLASLFSSGMETSSTNESLKYKPTKQPTTATQPATSNTTQQQASSSSAILFFNQAQAFKYLNNKYEPQGRLGIALLSNLVNNQTQYRLLLYVNKNQPLATIRVTLEFKLSVQKNKYVSFYDEARVLWSVLFDSEQHVAQLATQIVLTKCNQLNGMIDGQKLHQDLKVPESDTSLKVESTDSVEVENIVSGWDGIKLNQIENNSQKPIKLRLGKSKLPQVIEDLAVGMRQGERRLFVVSGNQLKSFYPSLTSSVVFYDLAILRVKKNSEKDLLAADQAPPLPALPNIDNEARSRSESIRDKTKQISDQLNDSKSDKAKLISRIAKIGSSMLPTSNITSSEADEDWSNAQTEPVQQQQQVIQEPKRVQQQYEPQYQQQPVPIQQVQQPIMNQYAAQPQSMIYGGAVPNSNQIALFRPQTTMSPGMYMYPDQMIQQQQPPPQQPPATQTDNGGSVVILSKLELINEKLEQLKLLNNNTVSNLPNMETSVLLHNIQRIVKENDQYKKDLYDKSNKIEEQNQKITELLMKAQTYVEQSHQILESKNNSFQSNAEKNQQRVLELEQDKMNLTSELSKMTSQISELNLEINRLKKADLEMRQQLGEVSKNTDQHKQNSERLLIENADLQTKYDNLLNEIKKEKQLRKNAEAKLQSNEEELNETKQNLQASQKLAEERKRKIEQDRVLFDGELDDLKRQHTNELNLIKERLAKARSNASESQSEQLKQMEADLNRDWEQKMEKAVQSVEQKYERKIKQVDDENLELKKQLGELDEQIKNLKNSLSVSQKDNEDLKLEVEDLTQIKAKYETFQSRVLAMKEKYEAKIVELTNAEPDAEVIGEEVKKIMNAMYKKIKSQIKPEQYYSGNGMLTAMLKIIKAITLQMFQGQEDQEEEVDYFSQHIYQAVEPVVPISQLKSEPVVKQEETIKQTDQVAHDEVKEDQSVANKSIEPVNPVTNETESTTEEEDDDIQLINSEEEVVEYHQSNVTTNTPEKEINDEPSSIQQDIKQSEEPSPATLNLEETIPDDIYATEQTEEPVNQDHVVESKKDLEQEQVKVVDEEIEDDIYSSEPVVENHEANKLEDDKTDSQEASVVNDSVDKEPDVPDDLDQSVIKKSSSDILKDSPPEDKPAATKTKSLFDDDDEDDNPLTWFKDSKKDETEEKPADETKVNAMRFSPPGLFGDDDEDEENDLFK